MICRCASGASLLAGTQTREDSGIDIVLLYEFGVIYCNSGDADIIEYSF